MKESYMNEIFSDQNHFPEQEDNSDTLSNIIIDSFLAVDGDQNSENHLVSS